MSQTIHAAPGLPLDRVIVMHEGKVIAEATIDSLVVISAALQVDGADIYMHPAAAYDSSRGAGRSNATIRIRSRTTCSTSASSPRSTSASAARTRNSTRSDFRSPTRVTTWCGRRR